MKKFSSLVDLRNSPFNSNSNIQRKTINAIEEARVLLDSGNATNPDAAYRLIDESGGVIAGYLDRQASGMASISHHLLRRLTMMNFLFLFLGPLPSSFPHDLVPPIYSTKTR